MDIAKLTIISIFFAQFEYAALEKLKKAGGKCILSREKHMPSSSEFIQNTIHILLRAFVAEFFSEFDCFVDDDGTWGVCL